MKPRFPLIPIIIGVALGFFFADVFSWHRFFRIESFVAEIPGANAVLVGPAYTLFLFCSFIGILPDGEECWNAVAWCIVVQWIFFGFLVAFILHWWRKRKKKKEANQQPDPTRMDDSQAD